MSPPATNVELTDTGTTGLSNWPIPVSRNALAGRGQRGPHRVLVW